MWFWYCVLVFAVFVLGVISTFTIWRWRLNHEVKGRIAAIRAQGLPINWEDLSRWPSVVPDSENGAFVYTNAFAHLHPENLWNHIVELPGPGETISQSNFLVVKRVVETNHDALALLYSASKYSKFRFPVDYSEGYNAKLPHLASLKAAAVLLAYEAFVKEEAKDADGAAKAVDASLHLAKSLENEPSLLSQLVGLAVLSLSEKSLERVVCRVPLSDASLVKLSGEFFEADATNRLLTGLIGERAMAVEYIRLANEDVRKMIALSNKGVSEAERTEVPRVNPGAGWRYLGFFERDRNFYLRTMETNLLIISTPLPAGLSLTKDSVQLKEQAASDYYIMSSLFLPDMPSMIRRAATMHANLRIALTAVAVERWRNGHNGQIPDLLDLLVPSYLPSVPIDPYNGQSLKFKKNAKGYVVYSVGPDLQDDGGKPEPPRTAKKNHGANENYDITFTVER